MAVQASLVEVSASSNKESLTVEANPSVDKVMASDPIAMPEVLEQPMVTFSADEVRAPPTKSPSHREDTALD